MTLPYEQHRAIIQTKEFLYSLMDPKKTPKVPRAIRTTACQLLRHFPTDYDADILLRCLHTEWLGVDSDSAIHDPVEAFDPIYQKEVFDGVTGNEHR